jgi:hypothetical protein
MNGTFGGRKMLAPVLAVAIAVLMLALSAAFYSDAKDELEGLRTEKAVFNALVGEARLLKAKSQALVARGALTDTRGVVEAVGTVVSDAGLKGKLKSVTPLGTRDVQGARAEEAELVAGGLTLDETIALLYRVQNAPMRLVIKKAALKRTFGDAQKLDLTMSVSFILPQK